MQDTLIGGAGADTLNGRSGTDVMIGGTGDDLYVFDSSFDWVWEGANGGYDGIIIDSRILSNLPTGAGVSVWMPEGIEWLRLWGGGFAGIGNAADNWISGGEGVNILIGGAGADTLRSGGGGDHLAGGAGADLFWLNSSRDLITIWDFEPGVDRLLFPRAITRAEERAIIENHSINWGPHTYMEVDFGWEVSSFARPNLKLLFVNTTRESLWASSDTWLGWNEALPNAHWSLSYESFGL